MQTHVNPALSFRRGHMLDVWEDRESEVSRSRYKRAYEGVPDVVDSHRRLVHRRYLKAWEQMLKGCQTYLPRPAVRPRRECRPGIGLADAPRHAGPIDADTGPCTLCLDEAPHRGGRAELGMLPGVAAS